MLHNTRLQMRETVLPGAVFLCWAAIVWMCRNQLGRRNVTKEQRDYLIKEEHDALLKTHGILDGFHGNQYLKTGLGENRQGAADKKTFQARKVIAKERGITESAVRESVEFGRGLDAAEKIAPGFRGAVLSGALKAPKMVIRSIRNIPEAQIPAAVEAIKSGDIGTAKEIIQQSKPEPDGIRRKGVILK